MLKITSKYNKNDHFCNIYMTLIRRLVNAVCFSNLICVHHFVAIFNVHYNDVVFGTRAEEYQTCQVSCIWRETHAFDCHVTLTHISVLDLMPFLDSYSLSLTLVLQADQPYRLMGLFFKFLSVIYLYPIYYDLDS